MQPEELLNFWFNEEAEKYWFRSTAAFDAEIKERFESQWEVAAEAGLPGWEASAGGALALVILLDQMPLNMYRDQPLGYSTEAMSREVAARAIEQGFDQQLPKDRLAFLYLPFMHSEQMIDQNRSVELFEAAGLPDNLRFAKHHREIVRRFGRFPHRNRILGRESTQDELSWLTSPDGFNP